MTGKKTYYVVQVRDTDKIWKFSEWPLTYSLRFVRKQEIWQLQNEPNVKTRILKLTVKKLSKKESDVLRSVKI